MSAQALAIPRVEVPIPVGTLVRKVNSGATDKIRDGHQGRIVAVHAASPQLARERNAHYGASCAFGYDVAWDALTGDCYVLGMRLEAADPGAALPAL